ncbi:MAG: sulfotransferase [Candidatus Limnocylindria bacterium]
MVTSPLRGLPDFLVIGAQKAGSTSLYRYLTSHPCIRMPRRKEVHFFDHAYGKGERWYRAQFPMRLRSSSNWLTGEASPYYLFHPHAPQRAARVLPHAKLIVVLRNPVDRAWSHYQHVFARGYESLSFESALEREAALIPVEERKMMAMPKYRSLAHERYSYLARGRYFSQLTLWLASFSRDQLFVLTSEQMFRSPSAALADCFSFLGLSPVAIDSNEVFKSGVYGDQMEPATRARLIEYFRPHNRHLEQLLGMALDWDR